MTAIATARAAPGLGIGTQGVSDKETRTPRVLRALRLARMAAQFILTWLAAVLVAGRLDAATRARLVEGSARRTLRILSIGMRLRGEDPLTGGRVLLVANHVSWLDIYALNAVAGARFVAKREVRGWPLVGAVAARFGTFFIVRGSFRDAARVKDAIAAALHAGDRVVVFPEGTTTDGSRVARFYAALLEAAVETGARVQPVAIRYPTADGRPHQAAAFVDDMSFVESLGRVLDEPALEVELTFGAPIDASECTRRDLVACSRAFITRTLGLGHGDVGSARDRPRRRAA